MANTKPLTLRGRILFGGFFILAGFFPMLSAFDIGPLGIEDINGPPWLGFAAGGVFVVAGLAVIVQKSPLAPVFAFIVLIGITAIGNWIAFGTGERVCSGNILFFGIGQERDLGGLACRIPFALGALIINAIVVFIAVSKLQKALGGAPKLARTLQLAEWGIWITLAPILIPMVLVLIARSAFEVLKIRLSTGAWPRNESFIQRQKRQGLLSRRIKKPEK